MHRSELEKTNARFEKLPTEVYDNSHAASRAVAMEIANKIREKEKQGEVCVLGLATGSTPTAVYAELVRMHKVEGLSFKNVVSFNLDEYFPILPNALQSYVRFMNEHLFDHIDILPENVHIPDGTLSKDDVYDFCSNYEKKINELGGLDIQILGIGRTGHIGFNEPGSGKESKTRLISLDHITKIDAASDFFGEENVPLKAITMGVGTIMAAKRIILMAWGEGKAHIVKEAVEGEISDKVPATYLQDHPNTSVILDKASSAELTRIKTPWLVGTFKWTEPVIRKAVIWLSRKLGKPILKLTNKDYNEYGMADIVTEFDRAYNINLKIFESLKKTITGWPGGKPNSDPTIYPERPFPKEKRVILFSPHPDDDVISMGGTFIRLHDQGHEVHVAYQTSGNIAVFDDDVIRFADFVNDFHEIFGMKQDMTRVLFNSLREKISSKKPGEIDSSEIQKIKGLIRRATWNASSMFGCNF